MKIKEGNDVYTRLKEILKEIFNQVALSDLETLYSKYFSLTIENGKISNFKIKRRKEERQCI